MQFNYLAVYQFEFLIQKNDSPLLLHKAQEVVKAGFVRYLIPTLTSSA